MNIALPLPYSNMTGILKLRNDNNNLIITSKLRRNGKGDEGIYIHTRFFTIRLPLAETFIIKEGTNQMLEANHKMWIFGVKFLEIDYEIKKIERSKKSLRDSKLFYVWVIVIATCLSKSLSQTR